jgi:mono/diheme cytochrome c family protein
VSTLLICFAVILGLPAPAPAARAQTGQQFFESKVRPILVHRCGNCHGEKKRQAGLQLTTRAGAFKGGDNGPVLVPGYPARSRLIQAVRRDGELKMPPKDKDKLSSAEIEALTQWVTQGAPWPEDDLSVARAANSPDHWAFQPVRKVDPPGVKNKSWPRGAIDRFILAKLEEKRLAPSRDAGKRVLLRRLTFDLTGLPPSPQDTEAFQRDDSPAALERVLDRLLASRQFGERWGRHWLDVARYADSNGSDENFTYYDAWRFRNYVLKAFQQDKPFDQFVREQIAGDLLPGASQEQRDEQITATGFLMLGPKIIGGGDKEQARMDAVDEQIDTVGKAFLGLTLGCARCHDHKFDPIPQKDYYALAGIFGSTETVHGQLLHRRDLSGWNLRPLGKEGAKLYAAWKAYDDKLHALKQKRDERQKELARLKKKVKAGTNGVKEAAVNTPAAQPSRATSLAATQEEISKLEHTLASLAAEIKQLSDKPPPKPPLAMAVSDREVIADARIRLRGDVHRHGETVPRGFVQVVNPGARSRSPAHQSGRLELAQWLVDPANPLTARVAANRIWHHLFGAGLVRTVDDFGGRGEPPSHPELLDYLAARFVEVDWSFKRMIREIVSSRAYQMSSEHSDEAFRTDPENRLLWRMNRRRLDVEALRDGILAISGRLDLSPTRSTVAHLPDQATGVGDKPHKPFESVRRSVYLPVIRNDLRPEFSLFDFANPQTVSGRRNLTIVTPQSLFLMNSPLLRDSARSLAEKLLKRADPTDEEGLVHAAYREVFGRPPSAGELQFSREYLTGWAREAAGGSESQQAGTAALAALCQALLCSSRFLYLD